jgi:hypothetical protein
MLNLSFIFGGAPDAGWFGYANLTNLQYSPGSGIDFWILGLQVLGVASLAEALNFVVTIINMRAPGMGFMRLPIFCWMSLITMILLLVAFPSITVGPIPLMPNGTPSRCCGIGFVNGLSYTLLLVFAVGLRRVFSAFGEIADFFGDVFYGAAILSILTNFVGGSLIGAVGLDAVSRPEASALRALYEGGGSLIGVFALFPLALMFIAGAAGLQRAAVFPRALVWIGYVAGV